MASDKKSKASKKSMALASQASKLPELPELADNASVAKSKASKKSKKSMKQGSSASLDGDMVEEAHMADKAGKAGKAGAAQDQDGGVVVPYETAPPIEEQTKKTAKAIVTELSNVVTAMVAGQNLCEDRAEIDPFFKKLQDQAQKIVLAVEKDAVYVEEVRHSQNRLSDLCDNTRAYDHGNMVHDLKHATNMRKEILTVIKGSSPDWELDLDEQDELRAVRNMLRRTFGGKKSAKMTEEEMNKAREMELGAIALAEGLLPSQVEAVPKGTYADHFAFGAAELEANLRASTKADLNGLGSTGEWATDLVNGN